MKKKIIPIAILFISSISYSQINIDDAPEKKISVITYDGSFPKLDYTVKDEVAKGLIGEKVTLLDVTYYDVELENGDRAPYEDAENFINKTYEITAYEKDLYPKFTIKSDLGTYKWKVTSSSKYVFNKFLDAINEKLLNKRYISLYNQKDVEALDGTKLIIDGTKEYLITKVSFTKFRFEYGIKVQINNDFELEYPTGSYDQPTKFIEGSGHLPVEGWINLKGGSSLALANTLIEKSVFEKFKTENSSVIDKIRKGVVAVGMTEQQCRWAWGMPNKSYGALSGYDPVYDWGGKTLYFKSGKLALIK